METFRFVQFKTENKIIYFPIMKKFILVAALMMSAIYSQAQLKIGLMVAPEISYGQVDHSSELTNIESDGSTLLGRFGLEFDYMGSDTYAFSTGLLYSPKRLALKGTAAGQTITEEYKIQYVQVPITVKLFTSEIQPDLKAYFQLGFLAEVLVNDEPLEDDHVLVDEFQFFDLAFTAGAGVEYGAGVNTIIYGGLCYDMGLVNVVKEFDSESSDDLSAKMRGWSLKLGLKF